MTCEKEYLQKIRKRKRKFDKKQGGKPGSLNPNGFLRRFKQGKRALSSVKDGKPGNVTMQLRKRYREAHDEDRWSTPVDYPV